MPKVEYGSILVTSTGYETPILSDSTLDVDRIVFFISSSSTESSAGYADGTTQFTGSAAYSEENTTKAITHYRNIGGTKTKVFEAVLISKTIGEFTIQVTTCTQNTVLRFVAYED